MNHTIDIVVGRVVKFVGIVTLIASFGVWVYAFSGAADRPPPDLLDDREWTVGAERLCAEAVAEVETMPTATDAESPEQRAEQIQQVNDRYRTMLTAMDGLTIGPNHDVQMTEAWRSDWRLFLSDRDRYARAIIDDPAAAFTVTNVGPERLYRRISRFALTNDMPSCVSPEDV